MDPVSRAIYELKFRDSYCRKRGNEFEDFFADIMAKAHPEDFIRVRPWGNVGDRKNDGYLRSERTLFQVYGPNSMSAAAAITKIEEDFHGALPFWREYFDRWVFVHNSSDGLGPDVLMKLMALDSANDILVLSWGEEELRRKVFELSDYDLASLLGPAVTMKDMLNLGLEALAPVLDQIVAMPAPQEVDLRPPPADKISRNMLSEHVETLLKSGMTRADLVRRYFTLHPTSRDELAQSFRLHYERMCERGLNPDAIFRELQKFAGGEILSSPDRQCAVLAVIAFFFEECDIYERDGEVCS